MAAAFSCYITYAYWNICRSYSRSLSTIYIIPPIGRHFQALATISVYLTDITKMFDKLAKELSEEDFLVDHYDENTHGATSANARQAKHQPTRFWKVIPWLVHIMGFMTYTSLICANFYSHRGSPCFSGKSINHR